MPVWMIKKIHIKRFRKIFEFSKENSEFYKKVYSDSGVLNLKIRNEEDIKKIPLIDKGMMNSCKLTSLLTGLKPEGLVVNSTSGSTGQPFDIYSTKKEHFTAYVRTFLATKGYNPFKPFVFIGPYKHRENIEKRSFLAYAQKNIGLFRREVFSVYTPQKEIIRKLRNRKINILSSSPSCLKVLIDELKKTGEKLTIEFVVVSGETLFDNIGDDIKTYLQAKIINVYGCMEHPSLAWTKPDSKVSYYALKSVYIEYINPVEINGDLYGELVITNLINKTMPFVRYKVGDHVKMPDSYKKMGTIIGRSEDIFVLNNGERIFMVQLYKFISIKGYSQYKFLQKKDKSIHFQAVCNPGVNKQMLKERILNTWRENFSEYPLEVEFFNELPINPKRGKFKKLEVET